MGAQGIPLRSLEGTLAHNSDTESTKAISVSWYLYEIGAVLLKLQPNTQDSGIGAILRMDIGALWYLVLSSHCCSYT